MSWLNEIRNFLEDYSGVYPENPDIDIWKDMGIVGDDFHEMMGKYSKQYDVDLSNYLWYFHTNEEGQNIGGLFFTPPNERVQRIPVTPQLLAKFIETKKWEIDYPDHKLPKTRIDLIINLSLFVIIIWILK
ncbi:DUF1493 family protein [Algivirga pacifica]|uniref:DUF1493 domain-containing protein n=1 Tax=Algivirga pacifica TaxID=1162670 RepID=A0ABP9DFN8_9BACT